LIAGPGPQEKKQTVSTVGVNAYFSFTPTVFEMRFSSDLKIQNDDQFFVQGEKPCRKLKPTGRLRSGSKKPGPVDTRFQSLTTATS
jgi:hypothetical protein